MCCGGVQVKKEAKELERQFGSGTQIRLPGKIAALVRDINGTDVEMATIMIFGEPHKCEQARAMLLEAVDNRDQKQKQRQRVCCSVCLIHEFVVGMPGYELRSAGAGCDSWRSVLQEYDRKKEEKHRNRQIYLMRHACDYETLGVPVGTPKVDLKAAYRKLALKWHPDKHPDNVEEAQKMFQKITKAYEVLMTTDEEVAVKAISAKQ